MIFEKQARIDDCGLSEYNGMSFTLVTCNALERRPLSETFSAVGTTLPCTPDSACMGHRTCSSVDLTKM